MLQLRFLNETELETDLQRLLSNGAVNMSDDTLTATVVADEIIITVNGASTGLRIAINAPVLHAGDDS